MDSSDLPKIGSQVLMLTDTIVNGVNVDTWLRLGTVIEASMDVIFVKIEDDIPNMISWNKIIQWKLDDFKNDLDKFWACVTPVS